MSEIPEGWLHWIENQLACNRSPFDLLHEMQQAGMDALQSQHAIANVFHAFMLKNTPAQLAALRYQYAPGWIPAGNVLPLSDKPVSVAFRLQQPDIVLVNDFLSEEECEALICSALDNMAPSTVANLERGTREPHAARSSSGTHLAIAATPAIAAIEQRLASLVGIPEAHGEALQVLHYLPGQEYQPHFDFFPELHAGSQAFLASGGQRIITLIMYLNHVEAGGETIFPNLRLSIQPRKGCLLYFSYSNAQGQLDAATLHGGAPVTRGEKWIATKWIRKHAHRS